MNAFHIILLIVTVTSADEEFKLTGLLFGCDRDFTIDYHRALQDFSTKLFKAVAKDNDHFVMSQYSVWLALAGIAEGTSENQNKILKILNLPEDSCLREKYYDIATSLESPGLGTNGSDVSIHRRRDLIVDNNVELNMTWIETVGADALLETKTVDFKNAATLNCLKDNYKGKLSNIELQGNSFILDSLDYEAFWTTAFTSTEENVDFFDDNNVKIGTVDMLKVKERVKLAILPFMNAKLLELRVGTNGRYRMLFIMNLGKTAISKTIEHFPNSFIIDSMPFLIESLVPLEVAIPRIKMTSELNLRKALENIGLHIWMNGNSSKYISSPPPQLSTYYQRVSISIDSCGLSPAPPAGALWTGLASAVHRDFIANRPFIYGLLDSQTRTWLFTGVFTNPNNH